MKIVLVDDELNIVSGLSYMIRKRYGEAEIRPFTDPQEALEAMTRDMPDLLITDIKMPEMSGLELIRQVRKMGLRFYAVLTGLDDVRLMQDSIRLQVSDYLFKPINKQELFSLIDRVAAQLQQIDTQGEHQLAEQIALCMQYGERAAALPPELPFTALLLVQQEHTPAPEAAALLTGPVLLQTEAQTYALYLSKTATPEALRNMLAESGCPVVLSAPCDGSQLHACFAKLQADSPESDDQFFFGLYSGGWMNERDASRLREYLRRPGHQPPHRLVEMCRTLGKTISFFEACSLSAAFCGGGVSGNDLMQRLRALPNAAAPQSKDVGIILEWLGQHYAEEVSLTQAASLVYLQANYFSTLFSREMGVGFVKYLNHFRVEKACRMIQQAGANVSFADIAQKTGFVSLRYFFSTFKRYTGMTPGAFRQLLEEAGFID